LALLNTRVLIPAKELDYSTAQIAGRIKLLKLLRMQFTGFVPDELGLKGKNAIDQFNCFGLCSTTAIRSFLETSANRKAFFVNYLFWQHTTFTKRRSPCQRDDCLKQTGLIGSSTKSRAFAGRPLAPAALFLLDHVRHPSSPLRFTANITVPNLPDAQHGGCPSQRNWDERMLLV